MALCAQVYLVGCDMRHAGTEERDFEGQYTC